jgi:pimeloyl-ACP methyl ester carboxylesterase
MFYLVVIPSALLLIALVGAFGYRTVCQTRNADALQLRAPNAIMEESYVRIGGIEQWVQIRGEDRSNPVVLVLHGGPGFSYVPFNPSFQPWEKHFTVIQWDQRGTGRTFSRNGKSGSSPMTIDQMVSDGLEVVQYLRKHLKKDRVTLFAHSWGTILGVPMVTQRPEMFSMYVGSGQIVDMPRNEQMSYDLILARVRSAGDEKAIKALESIGKPPYAEIKTWMVKGRMAVMHAPPSASGRALPNMFGAALTTPGYTLKDGYDLFAAFDFSSTSLYSEMMRYQSAAYGREFKIPVLIIQGAQDLQAPAALAKEFIEQIKAPRKKYAELTGEGHTAALILGDVLLKEIVEFERTK